MAVVAAWQMSACMAGVRSTCGRPDLQPYGTFDLECGSRGSAGRTSNAHGDRKRRRQGSKASRADRGDGRKCVDGRRRCRGKRVMMMKCLKLPSTTTRVPSTRVWKGCMAASAEPKALARKLGDATCNPASLSPHFRMQKSTLSLAVQQISRWKSTSGSSQNQLFILPTHVILARSLHASSR